MIVAALPQGSVPEATCCAPAIETTKTGTPTTITRMTTTSTKPTTSAAAPRRSSTEVNVVAPTGEKVATSNPSAPPADTEPGEPLVSIAPVALHLASYPRTCVINGHAYPNSILLTPTASEAARVDYQLPDATRFVATIGLVETSTGTSPNGTIFVQDGGTDQRTGHTPKPLPDTRVVYGRRIPVDVSIHSGTPLRIQGSAGASLALCVANPRVERGDPSS
ncbi:hypothetical protein CLV40_12916 [Actinokineospora auranticolor]|uniref:Uncharacterized protein n=2 Tax=Actinokineospora auranticolor TaxID=155976 RepID=A0A2S6GDK7_9PSEU|nr:hypothetical protein CLV40_12916 [Actinokineospora auranticolor]